MARARDRLELLGQGDDFDLDPRTATVERAGGVSAKYSP